MNKNKENNNSNDNDLKTNQNNSKEDILCFVALLLNGLLLLSTKLKIDLLENFFIFLQPISLILIIYVRIKNPKNQLSFAILLIYIMIIIYFVFFIALFSYVCNNYSCGTLG